MKKIATLTLVLFFSLNIMSQESPKGLNLNDKAPDFTATDQAGRNISLTNELKKGPVVLVVLRPTLFDWRQAGMTSECTWDMDDPYSHLPPELYERERKAAEIRSRLGWECPGGTRRI